MTRFRSFLAGLALVLTAALAPFAAQAQSLTNLAENKLVDAVFRGQALGAPATFYVALFTAAADCEAATVTEVSGGSYARVAVTSSLANWAGTQSAGSTTASSGTGGQTSNNGSISFPAPTANWGTVTHFGLYSASSGGDLWICQALATSKTVNNGDAAPAFNAGALTVTFQ
jgi:hypothetical protein